MLRSERVVEEPAPKSLKFTYEVTSDPDSLLCLAVVYEKALKILCSSVQRYTTDAVQSNMWLPQKYFFFFLISLCALLYNNIMAL